MLDQLLTLETLTAIGSAADKARVRLAAVSRIDHLAEDLVAIYTPVGDHDQLSAILVTIGEMTVASVLDRKRRRITIIDMGGLRATGIMAVLPIHPRVDLIDAIQTTRTAIEWHNAARAA